MLIKLLERMKKGEKIACSRLISVVENEAEGYVELLKHLHRDAGRAYIVGITGPPGAGKSTLTDKIVKELRKAGKTVGIIAVDPTSPFTKGAILGDRIRMSDHYLDEGVFIRSMGTRGHLGGLSKATHRAVKVLDVYGCDYIFIETVGVGQSEVDIVKMADTVLMVMVPGLGDDIQAIKAGVLEIGDVFIVNKADNDGAKRTFRELEAMLDFKKDWDFRPPVCMTVAHDGQGVAELVGEMRNHESFLRSSGGLEKKKMNRNEEEIREILREEIERRIHNRIGDQGMREFIEDTFAQKTDPYTVAEEILSRI